MSESQHINLLEVQAREKLGMPTDWRAYYFARMPPDGKPLYLEVRGAVVPLLKSGPRKGKPNWSKRDKSTEKTVCLPVEEVDAWTRNWESRTRLCSRCQGVGQVTYSWTKERGTTYRTCERCQGVSKDYLKGEVT